MKGEPCWFCEPAIPAVCEERHNEPRRSTADELLGAHRHLGHHLLQRWWQLAIEEVDERLLQEVEAEETKPRRRQRPESVLDGLKQYPEVRQAAGRRNGGEALFALFELRAEEADVFILEATGWTHQAIAELKGWRKGTVEEYSARAWYRVVWRLNQFDSKRERTAQSLVS